MKTTAVLQSHFNFRHQDKVTILCPTGEHGHDWEMLITVAGQPDRNGELFSGDAIRAIGSVLNELERNDPLLGANETPEGISAWAVERLRAFLPGLVKIDVGFPGFAASTEV